MSILKLKRPPLLPLILALVGMGVLCMLGNWQLQRLVWKNDLQAQLDTIYAEGQAVPSLSMRDLRGEDFTFKRGVIGGRYIADTVVFIVPRTYDGDVGKHMYAAFRMDDGGVVFVNRGWVRQDFSFLGEDGRQMPRQKLTGLFKKPPRRNSFTPQNTPESDQWYHPDLVEMAHSLSLSQDEIVTDYLFLLEEDGSPAPYPAKEATRPQLRNQHLQYAGFWFIMAGVLGCVFVLRFMRVQEAT